MLQKNLCRRLLSAVLILIMLFCMVACAADEPITSRVRKKTTATTKPVMATVQSTTISTQPTTPSTTPVQPVEPPVDSGTLVFTLTQADVDEFYTLLNELEQLCLVGQDLNAIDDASDAVDESYTYLRAQRSIAMILHYCHTSDEALEKQYLDASDIFIDAYDAYLQATRRVYQSNTPAKDYLFKDWTAAEIAQLLAYDEKVAQLQQRNTEISVSYRTSQDDDEKIKLYIEFVQNNNQIAQIYGYENYYAYAYELEYGRDYGQTEVNQLRNYARNYLPGIMTAALNGFYDTYDNMSFTEYYQWSDFLDADYDDLDMNYVTWYMQNAAGTNLSGAINSMLTNDSLFADADDAEQGAFTTTIGERVFCYYGPGYASSNTVIHEAGHYYAAQYTNLNDIPLDLAEVHSQGNEWLFMSSLSSVLPGTVYEGIVRYTLFDNVIMMMVCLMVDEFEEIVYTTDLTGFTAADFDAIMEQVANKYFPNNGFAEYVDMQNYWRQVVVEQPVYYISYAVSSIGAISLFLEAEKDFAQAQSIYQWLCESYDPDDGFLTILTTAGLYTPFDEEFYITLQQAV